MQTVLYRTPQTVPLICLVLFFPSSCFTKPFNPLFDSSPAPSFPPIQFVFVRPFFIFVLYCCHSYPSSFRTSFCSIYPMARDAKPTKLKRSMLGGTIVRHEDATTINAPQHTDFRSLSLSLSSAQQLKVHANPRLVFVEDTTSHAPCLSLPHASTSFCPAPAPAACCLLCSAPIFPLNTSLQAL